MYILSDGMRARLLIHACETTVTPAHDEPLEEQAARAQTNSGYARNGTLFPQVCRAAAPPFASKKFAFHGFFSIDMEPDGARVNTAPCHLTDVDPDERAAHVRGSDLIIIQIQLGGPEGPEPALGEKKPGLSHFGREQASKTTKVFAQQARGSRDFFVT